MLDTPNLGISISTPPSLVITDVGSSDPIIEPPFPFYSPPASPVKSPFLIDKLFEDASNDSSYLAPNNNNNSNNSNNIILHSPNHSGQLHNSRLLDPFTDSPKKRRSRSPRPRKSDSQDNSNSNSNNSSLNNSIGSNTSYSSPGDSSPNEGALNNNTNNSGNNSNNNIISNNNSNNSSNNGNRIGAYLYESTEIWKEEPETSKSVRLAICASPPIRKSPPLQSTNPDSSLNLPSIITPENPAC